VTAKKKRGRKMSIKNKHIIHMLDDELVRRGLARYLCIQACHPTPEKSTTDVNIVTCKNCLKRLREVGEE